MPRANERARNSFLFFIFYYTSAKLSLTVTIFEFCSLLGDALPPSFTGAGSLCSRSGEGESVHGTYQYIALPCPATEQSRAEQSSLPLSTQLGGRVRPPALHSPNYYRPPLRSSAIVRALLQDIATTTATYLPTDLPTYLPGYLPSYLPFASKQCRSYAVGRNVEGEERKGRICTGQHGFFVVRTTFLSACLLA